MVHFHSKSKFHKKKGTTSHPETFITLSCDDSNSATQAWSTVDAGEPSAAAASISPFDAGRVGGSVFLLKPLIGRVFRSSRYMYQ
jgi:hypothetical protein